ncbi:MAG: preprotein translocase subunit SecY [Candidatus Bathyarchaeota archaeon]|nr:MAG: preprotein translocase subunit SecY [Candidatus Bathyarchaeota archaeon]
MAGRFLGLFKPLARFLPEAKPPRRRVGFNQKILWTALALIIYLIMAEIPLYGLQAGESGFELSYLRVIFASNRGTLLELGIGPIVTAGLILQLLAGSGMIGADMSNPEDRGLFTTASKFFAILLTGVQAFAYIVGGVYGSLPVATSIVIFIQLLFAGVVIILLDEMIQKGWGIGSGISLFIMAGVAQKIVLDSFNPFPGPGTFKSAGAFPALLQTITAGQPIFSSVLEYVPANATSGTPAHFIPAVENAFIRAGDLPSLLGFFTTIAVFLIVIYVEGVRVELPVSHAGYRGYRGRYPIKLLYVSNLPVIFASALFANVYFFSQILWVNLNPQNMNPFLNLLGTYSSGGGQPQPTGGLVYYVIAPRNILDVALNPVRALIFAALMVAFCIIFSLTWLEVGGLGPSTVARQLVDSGMHIPGYRRSARPVEMVLKRYIPAVTILGGLIVGLIAAFADFFGVFGTGMGVLLSVGIIYQYYQQLMQERVAEMYPAFRRLFGG